MPYITDTLDSLNGGVSQQPPRLRHPSKASELVNGWVAPSGGVAKRPPLANVALLSSDPSGYRTGLVETFVRDHSNRFRVVVAGGDLKVFDHDTGAERLVHFPDGKDYLNGSTGFRALVVGGTMWVLNKARQVGVLAERSATRDPDAIIYIRQADFGTQYTVEIDGLPIQFTTAAGSTAVEREKIDTGNIAQGLIHRLAASVGTEYDFERYGSTIHVRRKDRRDFRISGSDGLADRGMVIVKDTVQRFEDLPMRAPDGFVCEVTGDPGSEYDNYWVRFESKGSGDHAGVWTEIAQPGTRTRLDPATMPHQLQYQGNFAEGSVTQLPVGPTAGHGGRSTDGTPGWQWIYAPDPEFEHEIVLSHQTMEPQHDETLIYSGQYVSALITPSFAGQARVIEAGFLVDTTGRAPGTTTVMALRIDNVTVWSKAYESGQRVSEVVHHEFVVPASGAEVSLVMTYTEPTPRSLASVMVYGTISANMGWGATFSHYKFTTRTLRFPDITYPEGWGVQVTLDGTLFTYTTPESQSGEQVAQGLKEEVHKTGLLVSTVSGRTVSFKRIAGGVAPTMTWQTTWAEGTHAYVPGIGGAHVGRLVKNLSDGSSGTVTASGPDYIVVGSLSGGTRNVFRRGDELAVVGEDDYFVFRRAPWEPRGAGKEQFPSFEGRELRTLFFTEGRLGVTSAGGSVVLSQAGEPLCFFRKSARLLLDDDVIDVSSAGRRNAEFHVAMEWDQGLFLKSDQALYRLSGHPMLSPRTVSLDLVAELPNDPSVRPVVGGSRLYFTRKSRSGAQVMEASVQQNLRVEAVNLGVEIPSYITGDIISLDVDAALGVLAVLTTDALFIYTFLDDPRYGRVLSAWSRWELPGTPVSLSMSEGVLAVLTEVPSGVYLGEIDLSGEPPAGPVYFDTVGAVQHPYALTLEFGPFYVRDENRRIVPGDLRVRYVELWYHNTTSLQLAVTPEGRQTYTFTATHTSAQEGSLRAPVGSKDFTMTLTSPGNGPCGINSLSWEGVFHPQQFSRPRQE
jgi:hypothetical protein